MVNPAYFKKIKEEIESYDSKRDELIRDSNKIVQLSKKAIYSVHRNEIKEAERVVKEMKGIIEKIKKEISRNPKLDIGSFKIAVQEYVEALCYLSFVKQEEIPTHSKLGIDLEYYLLGLLDLAGELGRNAVKSAIEGNIEEVHRIRKFVKELYTELMQIDFRNSELRKNTDRVRHELQKLDTIVLDLKMKGN